MTLEDFEKALVEGKEQRHEKSEGRHHRDRNRDRDRDRSKDRSRQHRHRSSNHHRRHSSRSRDRDSERTHESRHRDDDGHRHKRSRRSDDQGDEHGHKRHHHHRNSKDEGESAAPPVIVQEEPSNLKRDAWMEAPSALDIDYVHRPDSTRQEEPKPIMLSADYELKIHDKELNDHLRDLKDGKTVDEIEDEPASHEVDYTFGDSGSQWRMTKLKGVYREAEESGKPIDEIATARFGDLRSFDDAREEETEIGRRKTYGESYVGKDKPSGELFQERKLQNDNRRGPLDHVRDPEQELKVEGQGKQMDTVPPPNTSRHLDMTALNRLKAQMMKAKLRKAPNAADLEEQYNTAAAAMSNRKESDVVVLDVMHNPMLAGSRNEVKAVDTKRGRERGQVEANEDMSIEDMVREERKTRGQLGGEGRRLADQIGRDAKFEVSPRVTCDCPHFPC